MDPLIPKSADAGDDAARALSSIVGRDRKRRADGFAIIRQSYRAAPPRYATQAVPSWYSRVVAADQPEKEPV